MRIRYLYKDGKSKALTMSYDDAPNEDRRLVEIFNQYKIKGTFHLITGKMKNPNAAIKLEDIPTLYAGHEVSCHTVTHPYFNLISREETLYELQEDKKNIESVCGYPVRGMSYPYGIVTPDALEVMKMLGLQYGRTTVSTDRFTLPNDFMQWTPTCHHRGNIIEKIDLFKEAKNPLALFYIWGHSFEFPRNEPNNNWGVIETFCDKFTATFEDTVWYATNIEIVDYVTALRSLSFSADRTMVYNPSALSVWVDIDGSPVEIQSGVNKLA